VPVITHVPANRKRAPDPAGELRRTTERPARLGCWTRSFGPRTALMSHARDRASLAVQDRRG
jgi:hypothetical protein